MRAGKYLQLPRRLRDPAETTFKAERESFSTPMVLAAATLLYVVIAVLNFQTTDPSPGIALFYALPIAILALRFGIGGGLLAAAVASGMFLLWALVRAEEVPTLAYATRFLTFFTLGGIIGWLGSMLAANERRFQLALGTAAIAVFNMDRHLRYTWFRRTWENDQDDSMIGHTDDEILPPEDAAPISAFKRRVLETGQSEEYEACVHVPGQGSRWFRIFAEPTKDAAGKVTGLTATSLEITERKVAEQALAASERRFRSAVENLLEPFVLLEAVRNDNGRIFNFRVAFANSAAAALAGVASGQMVGRTFTELFPGRLESRLHDEYVKVVETGEPFFREAVDHIDVLGENTLVRAYDMRVSKLDDGVEVVWRDITDRVRAGRARDWVASIVESSADAIVGVRPDGTIESWSQGATRLYGYEPAEVIGLRYTVLFPAVEAKVRAERFRRALAGETAGPFEATELRKDGSEIRVSYTTSPIRGDDGSVVGIARIVRESPNAPKTAVVDADVVGAEFLDADDLDADAAGRAG
ncbi:MAG: PAS domain-containing protein [Actinobacteria bacterium]|nr:PAS domain-containing protein [Actinomycetota bacterium]